MILSEENCQIFKELKEIHKDLDHIFDNGEEPILFFQNGDEMVASEFDVNSDTRTLMNNIELFL